ncbi:MAG: hypothetical protein HZC54_24750 [Verrucomicrobia bacterium]|nr:hypothetical protein [Verrucomicrobiota bacterium]
MITSSERLVGYSRPEEVVQCLYGICSREPLEDRYKAIKPILTMREAGRTRHSRRKPASK